MTEEKTFKNENLKEECSKTHENKTKKRNFEKKQTNMQRQNKYEKKTKREIDKQVFFRFATVPSTCLSERLNVLETRKNEEKRKRQQMNKSMSKRTYRGNACIQKGIS